MKATALKRIAALFFTAQGLGTLLWWCVLLLFPSTRLPFLAPGAPDATLFALLLPDLLLFVAGSLVVAYGLLRAQRWVWPLLCVQAGGAIYAGLYALSMPLVSGGGWLGAVMMLPSLVLPAFFAWRLRPKV